MKAAILEALLSARAAEEPAVLATKLPTGEQLLLLPDREVGDLALDDTGRSEAQRLARSDRSATLDASGGRIFFHVFNPSPRLVIVGAVHIAEPLARMADSAGYTVVIVDPRRGFATRERFRDFTVVDDWPDEALVRLGLDQRTALVTLTHEPRLDDAALTVALRSPTFYIGCLGSRKTHAARLNRLRSAGFGDDDLARIHGPVGLAIGASTPAEIAVSILAEITRVRRGSDDQ